MAQWQKTFTQIENVNSGYEVELTDVPTPQMFNVALNNTQYLFDLLNAGYLNSVTIDNSNIKIGVKNASGTINYTTISISQLNGYTKGEVDNLLNNLRNDLNGDITTLQNRMTTFNSSGRYFHNIVLGLSVGGTPSDSDVGAIWLTIVSDRASYSNTLSDKRNLVNDIGLASGSTWTMDIQATGRLKRNKNIDVFNIAVAIKLHDYITSVGAKVYCIKTNDFSYQEIETVDGSTIRIENLWDVRVIDTKNSI